MQTRLVFTAYEITEVDNDLSVMNVFVCFIIFSILFYSAKHKSSALCINI